MAICHFGRNLLDIVCSVWNILTKTNTRKLRIQQVTSPTAYYTHSKQRNNMPWFLYNISMYFSTSADAHICIFYSLLTVSSHHSPCQNHNISLSGKYNILYFI